MSEPKIYLRGDGGYTLTEQELDALNGLRNVLQASLNDVDGRAELGLGIPIYTFLLELISESVELRDPETEQVIFSERVPKTDAIDVNAMRWIEAAVKVNSGEGI